MSGGQAARVRRCECCHGVASIKATWSSGSNFLCDGCFLDGQAQTDEVEAHEMALFGGSWGLPERPTVQPLRALTKEPDHGQD